MEERKELGEMRGGVGFILYPKRHQQYSSILPRSRKGGKCRRSLSAIVTLHHGPITATVIRLRLPTPNVLREMCDCSQSFEKLRIYKQ